MGRDGTALTEYDLTGKPGDESYMKQISYKSLSETYITNYGSAVFECEDGHTYLYGDAERKGGSKGPVVARTKSGRDLGEKWEYYVNMVYEMDQFAGDLVKAVEDRGEPAVVVFYGDHLPTMGLTAEDLKEPLSL